MFDWGENERMEKNNNKGIREMGVFHYLVKERKERGKKIEWVSPRPTNLNFSKLGGKWRKLGLEMQLQLFPFLPI